jgi:hypothetical protein
MRIEDLDEAGIEEIGPPPPPEEEIDFEEGAPASPRGAVEEDFMPAFDTRTADEFEAQTPIVETAGTPRLVARGDQASIDGREIGGGPGDVPVLRARGNRGSITQDGETREFEEPERAGEKPGNIGKFGDRLKFRQYLLDKMFKGDDPDKINPFEAGEEARRNYINEQLGGMPFYQVRKLSRETLKQLDKEADRIARSARETALKVKTARSKTVEDYMKRFDQDNKPEKETGVWAVITDPRTGQSREGYFPGRVLMEAQKNGMNVSQVPLRERPRMGRAPQWADIDGTVGLYTEAEIRKAQEEGRTVKPASKTGERQADILIKRDRALRITKRITEGFKPGDQIPPGRLQAINSTLEEAGLPKIKEQYFDTKTWRTMFGVKVPFSTDRKGGYYYEYEDGTALSEEPMPTEEKKAPASPRTPAGGRRVQIGSMKSGEKIHADFDATDKILGASIGDNYYPAQYLNGRPYITINGQRVWMTD